MKWAFGAVTIMVAVAGCGGAHRSDTAAIRAALRGSPRTYLHYGERTWGVAPRVRVRIRVRGDRATAQLSAPRTVTQRVRLRRRGGVWVIGSAQPGVINGPRRSRPASASDRSAIWAVERRVVLGGHDSCVRHVVVSVSKVDPNYATINYEFHKPYGDCALHNGVDIYLHGTTGWHIASEGDGFRCSYAPRGVVRSLFGACWVVGS